MAQTIVLDLEANSLVNPTQIWVVVCKDINTGEKYVYRKPTEDTEEATRLSNLLQSADKIIGHHILAYDIPVLSKLLNICIPSNKIIDTLVISKLYDYSKLGGHSIEQWGIDFCLPKIIFNDFSQYSKEMEDYCERDVEICSRIYIHHLRFINDASQYAAIVLEHEFQSIVNSLSSNGFCFNNRNGNSILTRVQAELRGLDEQIRQHFPPQRKLIRTIKPRITKYGTIHATDYRSLIKHFSMDAISEHNNRTFDIFASIEFNPSSHKQVINVLNNAGWKPTDKTTTHIEFDREHKNKKLLDKEQQLKYDKLKVYGYKINENNLSTLPDTAPSSAKTLAKRILLEARRRTLVEWLNLISEDGRIHGTFQGIGAWTHRMAHQKPNTANIPTGKKLYGDELRSLWQAGNNSFNGKKRNLLIGVDAKGIQLRIFAHYVNDKQFTEQVLTGDPHSFNQAILGCSSRDTAKRFLYAYLLGGGIGKLSEILDVSETKGKEIINRFQEGLKGLSYLKREVIPNDAKQGYFIGLDGRRVLIPGDSKSERSHLCMSGYLQNGEAIIMKKACVLWHKQLKHIEDQWSFVNFVHDEWQTECKNDMELALYIAETQAAAIRQVGKELNLKCPMDGNYYNDKRKDYTIGPNWSFTH